MTELVRVYRWPGDLVIVEPAPPGEVHMQPADQYLLDQLGADREAWFGAEMPAHDAADWRIGERVDVPIRVVRVVAAGGAVVAAILALWAGLAAFSYALYCLVRALRHAGG